ncbi:MAG: TlpA disulfide reductase family protein [Planctomycetota bacterium]
MRIAAVALPTLIALSVACGPRQGDPASGPGEAPGAGGQGPAKEAEAIRFTTLEELDRELASLRGRPVLVNFWAIWCVPCVAELPELQEVYEARKDQGLAVLAVSYDLMVPDATRDNVLPRMRAFVEKRRMTLPVRVFDGPDYDAINERLGLPGEVPVTLAFDASGEEVDRVEGRTDRAGFERLADVAAGKR